VNLFSQLYIAAKNRNWDRPTFFEHENQVFPLSLSDYGALRSTTKSDLILLLPVDKDHEPPDFFDAIAVDGAAVVCLLPTASIKTFDEYTDDVFCRTLSSNLRNLFVSMWCGYWCQLTNPMSSVEVARLPLLKFFLL